MILFSFSFLLADIFSFQESQEDGWCHATTFANLFYVCYFTFVTVICAKIKYLSISVLNYTSTRLTNAAALEEA